MQSGGSGAGKIWPLALMPSVSSLQQLPELIGAPPYPVERASAPPPALFLVLTRLTDRGWCVNLSLKPDLKSMPTALSACTTSEDQEVRTELPIRRFSGWDGRISTQERAPTSRRILVLLTKGPPPSSHIQGLLFTRKTSVLIF